MRLRETKCLSCFPRASEHRGQPLLSPCCLLDPLACPVHHVGFSSSLSLICSLLWVSCSSFTYLWNRRIKQTCISCSPPVLNQIMSTISLPFFWTHSHLFTYWRGAEMRLGRILEVTHLKDNCACPETWS